MKNNCIIISKNEAVKWYSIANLFAKSLFPFDQAIKQFNSLTAYERKDICYQFKKYDEKRQNKIPKDENVNSHWAMSLLVDSNIIATEFGIDPLTACLCIHPPCKNNQRVIIK